MFKNGRRVRVLPEDLTGLGMMQTLFNLIKDQTDNKE